MNISFVWFDIGYTLLYMQREITYQKALREFGIDVPLAGYRKRIPPDGQTIYAGVSGFFFTAPRSVHARLSGYNELSNGAEC